MKNSPLFFDFQSSTPCLEEVIAVMQPYLGEFWGNPSSKHNRLSITSAAAVELAREQISSCLSIEAEKLIFTSGATESNNLALLGHARAHAISKGKKGHLITMTTEHHAILDPIEQLKAEGFKVTKLRPKPDGLLSIDEFKSSIHEDTFLVSIMFANNEIGVVQPINEIAKICRLNNIVFHSDAAQGFCFLPLNIKEIGLDLVSISAHKLYGPKGIGALIINKSLPIIPLQFGGGQEKGLRSGTLPVHLIVGFAKAVEIAQRDYKQRVNTLINLRDELLYGLKNYIPKLIINGSMKQRLPHNINISIPDINGNRLHQKLRSSISCSSGSACSQGQISHVLLELGRSKSEAEASVRLSLGINTTQDDIKNAIRVITEAVRSLEKYN